MSDMLFRKIAESENALAAMARLGAKGFVTAADVASLRREFFAERPAERSEIEALLVLDRKTRPAGSAWADLLVELVTEHVVWDVRPTGILCDAQAEWLLRRVDAAKTAASFAVLVSILEEAHRVPNWFPVAVRKRAAAGWPGVDPSIGESVDTVRRAA